MVMAQSLFKLLKQREPAQALDVLAPAWSLPIVARMPEIRSGIASGTAHGEVGLGKRRRTARELRRTRYDRAIILPRSFKAALIPWLAGIPIRTGYRGESRFWLINDRALLDQPVKRFAALGLDPSEPLPEIPYPALRTDAENQRRLALELSLDISRPVVAMMPGAEYGPAKCWPLDYFAELAALLDAKGYSVWVLGSDKDAAAGDRIAASSGAVNLCGKTALADVIDLLELVREICQPDH